MADTIITNTPARTDDSGALGWVVALIVVLAVIVGGYVWYQRGADIPNTGGTNINVEVPAPTDIVPDTTVTP